MIKGLPIGTFEERVSLYEDDTLVYLADTHDSLKVLLSKINTFGDLLWLQGELGHIVFSL